MARRKEKNTGKQPVKRQTVSKPDTHPINQKQRQTVSTKGSIKHYPDILLSAAIAVITWLFLKVCINNQFTDWDDPGYITNNHLIKDISPEGLQRIFSTSVLGNYHPLTILSYALEYSYAGLEPMVYHVDSLLLHILVVMLVYWFVFALTRRRIAAVVTSLLFGLHPMHVEPFAWLSGRKDLLYGAFYMAACIAYVYYVRASTSKKTVLYAGIIVFFICALLSKPIAVALPVTLLIIDYFERRKWSYWLLIEKIPHFCIAVAFGIKALADQRKVGAFSSPDIAFNFIERIALGCYALITYLWKAVLPVRLCNLYPYPFKEHGALPAAYYAYPLAAAAIFFILWKFTRKNRVVIFGSLFFLANIALLLQFIPVGGAIIADRYAYIPYFGLFFMAGELVSGFFESGSNKQSEKIALGATIVCLLFFGYLSNDRCSAWYDNLSLWHDEIEKEPVRVPGAWNNLGNEYTNRFKATANPAERKLYYDSAFYLLNRATELQPSYVSPYIALGLLLRANGKNAEAKYYYYKAISVQANDNDARPYLGLAPMYAMANNLDSAGYCFRKALQINPNSPMIHTNLGNVYDMMGKPDFALAQYTLAIAQKPDIFDPYMNRGRLLQRLHRCDEAIRDFEKAIQIRPELGEIYYARSYCYNESGNKALALQDVEKAISLGFNQIDNTYYQSLRR